MLKAEIYITLKQTVVDPQGETVRHALSAIGYKDLKEVRMGKLIVVQFNYQDKKKAVEEIEGMCRKLLANPVIENYSYKINKA
ncbi:MAG: phosphoribosylformylglycinamidine synthase subunit PurS [Candidatus Omnitrophota bacterium]